MNFNTPGIYIKEAEVARPQFVRMDIAGFVGQAQRGPLNYPQRLTDWGQFQDIFGDFTGFSYLSYAVFGFFLNGGRRCYVVRVAHEEATGAAAQFADRKASAAFRIESLNQGSWGNDVSVNVVGQSGEEFVLTETAGELMPGDTAVAFKSVSGLAGLDISGAEGGDQVTLIHPTNPFIREEKIPIAAIDYATGRVTFCRQVSQEFPAGSRVVGAGFKLEFLYRRQGEIVQQEVFDNLSLDENHERYFVRVINGDPEIPDYVDRSKKGNSVLVRVSDLCSSSAQPCARPRRRDNVPLQGGTDGEQNLPVQYFTGYQDGAYFRPRPANASAEELLKIEQSLFGLAAFEAVDEIGTVALPDAILPDLYQAVSTGEISRDGILFTKIPTNALKTDNLKSAQYDLLRHCEKMADRFAILYSPPGAEIGRGANKIEEWPENFKLFANARFGALYYPWIKQRNTDFAGRELFIPPDGHLAGIFAHSELEGSVGEAPANRIVLGVVELEFCVDDGQQAILNPRGVNCLRIFPGRGIRVWGARTLSVDPAGRYVNIRRFGLAVVKNILIRLQYTVFEPNNRDLWEQIVSTLSLFFLELFEQGALVGAVPEEAFFVKCDEETNPPEAVDSGQVVTLVGYAPVRPAEFILLTIRRTGDSITVKEQN